MRVVGEEKKETLYLKEQLERAIHKRKCQWLHHLHLATPYPVPIQAKPCLSSAWKRSWKSFKLVDSPLLPGLPEHTEPNAIPIETHSSCCQVSPSTSGTSSCSRAINAVQLMALLFWLAEMVSLNSSSLVTMAIELEFNYLLERSPDSCGVGFSTWMLLGSQEKHQGLVRTAMF